MGFAIGQQVADYEVVGVLGSGGMGRVYQVRNVISHRTEAMKVLFSDLNEEPALASRFRGEIRTVAGLHHPNIAQLHTALQNGNELLMIMEFVEGCTLHQLAQECPLPLEEVAGYIQQVLTALSYAHSHGVIHRDVKPANIIVTPQGAVKLTDFGIAKSKAKDELTRPGTTLGSLNYMSPEQARGSGTADERSDIYSVGITLYELLTGQLPFDDESAYVVLHRQLTEPPLPPMELNPDIPPALNDLIMKCLEKEPEQRFQTAAELSHCLRQVTRIDGSDTLGSVALFPHLVTPIRAGSDRIARTAALRRPASRIPWFVAAAATACMGLVAFTAVGLPHFPKRTLTAKTANDTMAPSSSVLAGQPQNPTPVAHSSASPLPARVVALRQTAIVAESARSSPAGSAAPKLSRVLYPRLGSSSIAKPKSEQSEAEGVAPEADSRPVLSATTLAAVQGVRRQKQALDARASVIRARMTRLRTQTMLDGHELNQGMADAYVNMNTALAAEDGDLESGNIEAAQGHMEKATAAASLLEKLLNP